MSSQTIDLKLKGLYTSPNNLSGVPQGALQVANNVVLNAESIITTRRGQTQYGTALSISTGQINKLFNYASSLIVSYNNKMAYDSDGAGTWVDYSGTYVSPATDFKIRSLEALRNFYWTSSTGIWKIDSLTATPRLAGVPQALGGTGTTTGSSGFLQNNTAVAYRMVWGYIDANNNLNLGAPSSRVTVSLAVYASLTNQGVTYTANAVGVGGDSITITLINPGTNTSASVTTTGNAVVVTMAYSGSAVTTTATTLVALLNADATTAALITATGSGASILSALPATNLLNGNSSTNVSLSFTIPNGLTTQYFYQIYRSIATLTATGVPSDELQLVLQSNLTSGEISAKSFTVTDITPVSLLGATLYTSPSQQGIENSNYPPPLAYDMDIYKTCAFYANIVQKQSLTLSLLSVGSTSIGYVTASSGVINGTTTISGISNTAIINLGMRAVGANIPANAYVTSITNTSTLVISAAATASTTESIEFQDFFAVGDVQYWAGSSKNTSTNQFLAYTAGTPAQNIDVTAQNLVNLINIASNNSECYAYYISDISNLPGQILFQEQGIGGVAFIATSSNGASFSPILPNINQITAISIANPTHITSVAHGLTSGQTITIYDSNSTPSINGNQVVTVLDSNHFTVAFNVTVAGTAGYWILTSNVIESNNGAQQNQVLISQQGDVEAVPSYQFFNIGSANFPIKRVIALRDGIFFFKNDGIYVLSGQTFANFVVTLLDNTVLLKVPESAVAFNNQIFCFTTQAIVAVTNNGVQIMSVPIEQTLLELASPQYTNFVNASFGVAYESERLYMFFTVTQLADAYATQAFVYNSLTNSWTCWPISRMCGVVNTTINKLFLGEPNTGQVLIERKSYTNNDYADKQYNVNIASIQSSTQLTLSSAANVQANDSIVQSFRTMFVYAVNGNVLTVDSTFGFTTGAAIAYQAILSSVQWCPINAGNPGILKQFSEVSFFFYNAAFNEIDAGFNTNIYTSVQTVPLLNNNPDGWGTFIWGGEAWGGVLQGQRAIRTYVPQNMQRCNWLFISLQTFECFQGFTLQGVSLIFNPMSSRFR